MRLDYSDSKAWDLLCAGHTKGVFQCESRLVQQWLKKIKPRNLWELSAVISLVRPGSLASGMADIYVEYKHGTKEFESFGHPIIDEVFKVNHGSLAYQEQIMSLGARLAWPDLPEKEKKFKVDVLRKAVGKKNQQKILEIGKEFVDGCIRNKVEQSVADKLFEVIKNCGRYLFNLSHSIKYAHIAYQTAFRKAHYPLQFYATYLSYAKFRPFKWDEMADLIQEARLLGTEIQVPQWNLKNTNFRIVGDKIVFGLSHIKHGPRDVTDLPEVHNLKDFVFLIANYKFRRKLKSSTTKALIGSGAFTGIGYSRKSLLNIFSLTESLSNKENEYLLQYLEQPNLFNENAEFNLEDCVKYIINNTMTKRKFIVESLWSVCNLNEYDHPQWIQETETDLFGTYITATKIDGKYSHMTVQCKDCLSEWKQWSRVSIACVVKNVRHTVTKKGNNPGQEMATITVFDTGGQIDGLPVFPEKYQQYCTLLNDGNPVMLNLVYGKTGWIIDSMEQL